MPDPYYIVVILVSLGAAFFSGLLGIGGGIIIFPAFLYLMPFLGYQSFSVNEITGIAAAQSFAGVFFAFMSHRKFGTVNFKLMKAVLPAGIIGAFSGAIIAKFISEKTLLFMYLILLVFIVVLMLIPKQEGNNTECGCSFKRPYATNFFIFIGTFASGSLGFAGAATFIPILNHFCEAPLKVAISTTTVIVLISTALIFAGKASVGLIPYGLIPWLIIGSLFGATIGSKLNKKLSSRILRIIFLLVVLVIGARILLTIVEG